jgi:outer membrane protein assembly factor BamD
MKTPLKGPGESREDEGEKMHRRKTFLRFPFYLPVLAAAVCLVFSCGASKDLRSDTPQARFAKAKKRYDAERYLDATEQFKAFLASFPGSKYAEPATFFLGKSRFGSKEYLMAEVEFERIIRDFPRGEYAEEASFMLGMCAYEQRRPVPFDQASAERAILVFRMYMSAYPDGAFAEKADERIKECRLVLAEKLHANGVLYLKLHDSKAARMSFEEVLEKYDDLHWADWALLGIARSYEQERNWTKATEMYEGLVEREGDAEALAEARDRLRKIRDKAGSSGSSG